ncbi:type I secretion system permease/ATPase [Luminiphilus sp.]|nr:type I secretion system permease/ATPase [Luminiphilus sp.]
MSGPIKSEQRQFPPSIYATAQECRSAIVGVAVFSGIANLLMLTPAFFMLSVYDKAVANNSLSTLWVLIIIAVMMYGVLAVMEAVRSHLLSIIASKIDRLLAPILYDISFYKAKMGGGTSSGQVLIDLNQFRQFVTGAGILAFFDAPWIPIYLAILFLFHPILGWMGVAAVIVFWLLALVNQRQSYPALSRANELAAVSRGVDSRNLRNAEAIASMGMNNHLRLLWRTRQDKVLELQELGSKVAGTYSAAIKVLRIAVQSAAIAAGAFLVINQEISPGMIIAGSILVGRALQPVETAVGTWRSLIDARGQFDRIIEALKIPMPDRNKMALPEMEGHVRLENATVVPPGAEKPAVFGANAAFSPGSVTMLVGRSGAGKTSLVRGLLGLWPVQHGHIRVDGADIFSLNSDEFGPQIGYLPQAIELLEGSVKDNIARFGEVDSSSVVQAAKDAEVHEFILSLSDGYETLIGSAGNVLSPGQRQRIALARAIYKRPKLIVLDEPNSNLDQAGENALNSVIKLLKENRSSILLVSHRQGVLPLVDQLIVMEGGRIIDQGPPTDVVARGHERQKAIQVAHATNGQSAT